jgi:hypothetical protein
MVRRLTNNFCWHQILAPPHARRRTMPAQTFAQVPLAQIDKEAVLDLIQENILAHI